MASCRNSHQKVDTVKRNSPYIISYFLILTSNENNSIHLFITQTPEWEIKAQFL